MKEKSFEKADDDTFCCACHYTGETIYYALESKLAGAYNADNGKEFWTAELKETPQSPFVYIPSYNFLAISLEQDYLQVLKATNGESMFKFNTYNEGELAHLLPPRFQHLALSA